MPLTAKKIFCVFLLQFPRGDPEDGFTRLTRFSSRTSWYVQLAHLAFANSRAYSPFRIYRIYQIDSSPHLQTSLLLARSWRLSVEPSIRAVTLNTIWPCIEFRCVLFWTVTLYGPHLLVDWHGSDHAVICTRLLRKPVILVNATAQTNGHSQCLGEAYMSENMASLGVLNATLSNIKLVLQLDPPLDRRLIRVRHPHASMALLDQRHLLQRWANVSCCMYVYMKS